jgi:hypothetical protein
MGVVCDRRVNTTQPLQQSGLHDWLRTALVIIYLYLPLYGVSTLQPFPIRSQAVTRECDQ